MDSAPEFKCVFCNEIFSDKEELQVHFRKHADPEFNQKKRWSNSNEDKQATNDTKEPVEMVECDVCPEVFTSISKAITHKHKFHPEHAAKYFCPWCGKLFTMKYLFNKHLSTNHTDRQKNDDKYFHCDMCDVDFHIPTAMVYHNKFFHRQDTDLPAIGNSKKLKLYNQEAVMIYYCPFCGEEYENKVNLHKHLTDEHSDENQSPDSVFRCPLCEAIFYHLDAYQLHLMHHSVDDTYSERNEMADTITEISFESVPPIAEKVEEMQPETTENTDNLTGIHQLLELAMEEPKDKKHKKHKKHKKSKKSAITLDEFLNMNKDVFGEEIDFQGVEEVPTPVVKKKIKTKKVSPSKALPADIEKLKKQGIVVKKNVGGTVQKMVNKQGVLDNNVMAKITNPEVMANNTKSPDIVISKFLNQPNNQIKIVKKTNNVLKATEQNEGNVENGNADTSDPVEELIEKTENVSNNEDTNIDDPDPEEPEIDSLKDSHTLMKTDEQSDLPNHEQGKTTPTNENSEHYKNDISESFENYNSNNQNPNVDSCDKDIGTIQYKSADSEKKFNSDEAVVKSCDKSKTLQALKNLSHLTVKSMSPVRTIKDTIHETVEHNKVEEHKSPIHVAKKLKLSNTINKNMFQDGDNESETDETFNEGQSDTINKIKHVLKNPNINIQTPKQLKNLTTDSAKESSPQKDMKQPSANLLKNLKNITAKPLNTKVTSCVGNTKSRINIDSKNQKGENQTTDDIEIFNIDDSDDDQDSPAKTATQTQLKIETNKSLDAIKNLNKNLTIKSIKSNENVSKAEKQLKTEDEELDENDEAEDDSSFAKSQKEPCLKQNLVNSVLRNLSKNITVKSRTSSPIQIMRNQETTYDTEINDPDSDHEVQLDRVQIKEVTNTSEDEINEDIDQNPKIEHPDEDFNSDNDQYNEEFNDTNSDDLDFDESINANKPIKSTPHLDTLKKLSKNITIKPAQSTNSSQSDDMPRKINQLISNKNYNQINSRNQTQSTNQMMNQQNVTSTSANQVNTKEVKTVKTFKTQTETVIEEVTTTVTKTIKTVNQTNQVVRNQINQSPLIRPRVVGMNVNRPQNYQGIKVRQASPTVVSTRPRIRNPPTRAPRPTARSQNQLVPIRPALMAPQIRNIRPTTILAQSSPQNQIRKPVKLAPGLANAVVKRPNNEETSHFSCFKKPKESLIPISEESSLKPHEQESVQYSSKQMSKSNYSCTTKSIKGSSLVMSSQIKSEMSASTQQLSKLRNMTGLSVVKTNQVKQQCVVEEKSENVASDRTLEAIQKLQSQGLLVKKPRFSASEESEHSNPASDDGGHFSNEEFDE